MTPTSGAPRSGARASPVTAVAATPVTAVAVGRHDSNAQQQSTGSYFADDVSAPEVMDTEHLARFEFSSNGGGTKILMVEWNPGAGSDAAISGPAAGDATGDTVKSAGSATPKASQASDFASLTTSAPKFPLPPSSAVWEVSWPGKSTFLPARDNNDDDGSRRRVYFLLPPDAAVPATVTITRPGRPSLQVKPLPAIFPERFAAELGTHGVLHTIWARKRLSELKREIDDEMRANAESVGLEMALAEKLWIEDNFLAKPAAVPVPMTPMSPRSPIGGRLGDKLKGLRLATSPADLVPSPTANTFTDADSQSRSLSPLGGDIAVSSFSSISRSGPPATSSLDATVKGDTPLPRQDLREDEEELFALPLSPRSPDMARSPFSILGGAKF